MQLKWKDNSFVVLVSARLEDSVEISDVFGIRFLQRRNIVEKSRCSFGVAALRVSPCRGHGAGKCVRRRFAAADPFI